MWAGRAVLSIVMLCLFSYPYGTPGSETEIHFERELATCISSNLRLDSSLVIRSLIEIRRCDRSNCSAASPNKSLSTWNSTIAE